MIYFQRSSKTLGHICLHVESIKRSKQNYRNVLPQYSCLVLSPTNFWHQDVQIFAQDNSILNTIFSQHVSFIRNGIFENLRFYYYCQ